ncbi:MAG: lytic transglycosylase domain-containing protein [Candidatus Aminicenantes bacterium]|nr:lytic transglycosylase domain-containing protein [Candidatus Aminicenantes bacterium]
MMQKNPVKKFAVVLSILTVLAIGSLLAQMVESNHNYERSLAHIQYLRSYLGDLHGELLQLNQEQLADRKKYERLDLLEYKAATFHKTFPDFARIVDVAYQRSQAYGFHPNLVLSVIQVESAFNPMAVSSAGAYGLMQVRYAVWKDELNIDMKKIFDIDYNIELGLKILKQYHEVSGGNLGRTLFLYNNGYKYNNSGYITKVNASIYNQGPDSARPVSVSR